LLKNAGRSSAETPNTAARIITKADYSIRSHDVREELSCPTLYDRQTMQMNIMMYKVYHAIVPEYLTELFLSRLTSEVHNYNFRGSKFDRNLPKPKTNSLKRSFAYRGATAWNGLPNHVRTKELNNVPIPKQNPTTVKSDFT